MADIINFSLPNLDPQEEDTPEMKFIKNYLAIFTEQVRFYLNNIDEDNLNTAYSEQINSKLNNNQKE